ncbi:KpsF/GutQ family sugar-phosphate isomerase [Desulfovibrio inopinatus]|uniref:KpsF/GutQ family sugar-phosphate isomerase n=1 Tax=Desulfovibrio inopinatus TaxID=102109 RepID=UPI00041C1423|nr:KpsF/GutQ family sugar-phosphate isomerase [Desulfovibrio inopinatus]
MISYDFCKDIFENVIDIEVESISKLKRKIPQNIDEIIDVLLSNGSKVVITGIGKSGIIGKKIAATLSSTGTSSFFVHPSEAYHGDLGMIGKDDIVLAISYSGETEELLRLVSFVKKNENTLIVMTGCTKSTLAQNADYIFDISVTQEACPLQLAPTSSTTATLVIGDALAMTLMKARNFMPDDFARFHPGGSLGRRLLTTVDMVMKSSNLPFVQETDTMVEVAHAISRGRLGLAIVLTKNNNLYGVISDGDLRRAMSDKKDQFFTLHACDLASPQPKFVAPKMKLVDAEALMNQHKITSLLVVDKDAVVGVIQVYDL